MAKTTAQRVAEYRKRRRKMHESLKELGFEIEVTPMDEPGKIGWTFTPKGTQEAWDLLQSTADDKGVALQEMADQVIRELIAERCLAKGVPFPQHSTHI